MKVMGLACRIRIKKFKTYKGEMGKKAANLLNRNFTATAPNQKWVTDVTEMKIHGEKLYLSALLDLYNGEIIAYTTSARPVYTFVQKMLDQAFTRVGEQQGLLLHSDQGWHYRIPKYHKMLETYKVTQSMSRKGNCHDNAVIENFFGIFKSELLYAQEFESMSQFKSELKSYIHYYNEDRIKTKLAGMSPIEFRRYHQQAA